MNIAELLEPNLYRFPIKILIFQKPLVSSLKLLLNLGISMLDSGIKQLVVDWINTFVNRHFI
jgi:hypothetical protein